MADDDVLEEEMHRRMRRLVPLVPPEGEVEQAMAAGGSAEGGTAAGGTAAEGEAVECIPFVRPPERRKDFDHLPYAGDPSWVPPPWWRPNVTALSNCLVHGRVPALPNVTAPSPAPGLEEQHGSAAGGLRRRRKDPGFYRALAAGVASVKQEPSE